MSHTLYRNGELVFRIGKETVKRGNLVGINWSLFQAQRCYSGAPALPAGTGPLGGPSWPAESSDQKFIYDSTVVSFWLHEIIMRPSPVVVLGAWRESSAKFGRLELSRGGRIPPAGHFEPLVPTGYPTGKFATNPGNFAKFGLAS